jgi:hypothetical protein
VSVAVGTRWPYGDKLARIVIRRLVAYDAATRVEVVIEPGKPIDSCRIRRNPSDTEHSSVAVYVMEFLADGRLLRCPLVQFQARTQATAGAEPAPDALKPLAQ